MIGEKAITSLGWTGRKPVRKNIIALIQYYSSYSTVIALL